MIALPLALEAIPAAIFAAAAALLILYALYILIVQPVAQSVRGIPIVGPNIEAALTSAMAGVTSWAESWAKVMVWPIVQLVAVPVRAVETIAGDLATAIEAIVSDVRNLSAVAAGSVGAVATRVTTLAGLVSQLWSAVGNLTSRADGTDARIGILATVTMPGSIAAAVTVEHAWAGAQVASEQEARVASIADLGTQLARVSAAETAARVAGDEAATAALGAEAATLRAAITTAEAGLGQRIDAGLGDLSGRVGTLAGLLSGIAVAPLAMAVEQVITRVETMDRECVTPGCDYLGPQLGNLSGLQDVATIGILAALVAAAVEDPDGTAREVAAFGSVLRPIVAGLVADLGGPAA